MEKTITKKEREQIFSLFTKNNQLKFNEIEKQINIRSNHLSYHLTKLIENQILVKDQEYYKLTKEAEKMIPFFAHLTGKEKGPLSIIVAAVLNKNKICLLKRNKRPYPGYWGLIGGKLKLEESIKTTALRETKEETNLDCKFEKISAVLHERVKDQDLIKHSFIIFLCKLKTNQTDFKQTEEGKLEWFDLNKLPENIIPSDKLMITQLLNQEFCCKDILIEDKEGFLTNMDVQDGGSL